MAEEQVKRGCKFLRISHIYKLFHGTLHHMKRLGFFCLSALLCIGFLLAGTASTTHAQGIDRIIEGGALPSQGTYDYFYNKGIAVFTETLTALNKIKDGVNASNSSTKEVTSARVDEHIKLINDTQSAYIAAFNTAKARAVSPTSAQIEAITAGSQKFQNGYTAFSPKTKQEPLAKAEMTLFTNKFNGTFSSLLTEAKKIENGTISAGSDYAKDLGNATPITTSGETLAKIGQDPNQCAFWGGNLLNCIDQLFTWFIKNTLLRIAGVVLWLCANMLDYAINIGILQFSTWAPSSLYDLWIVVRQITSLAIVFAGLYLGFLYIVGKQETFARYIGWVIIYALFVNFSYPITRMLIDVSNIVALNVYSTAIPSGLTDTGASAGKNIMDTLGLQSLVNLSTNNEGGSKTDIFKEIKSTPVALITVAFVAYAAYIFFRATAIIAVRTAVLVFLTIGSPFLLIDSVVPKLGEWSAKMRKLFFEQLIVAPVFVIMLAITLKFMTVFRASGAMSGTLAVGNLGGAAAADASITLFFSVLMMLVMLHIMLKVTESIAGEVGKYATSAMGKVGGFGLAAATGGTGLLARGTIGQAALRARNSAWMDKMKDTTMGRGLYGLSNSLAQSTYDARNIGMVGKGLATAGLTGGLGFTMQGGAKNGFEAAQQERTKRVKEFGSNIKDDTTRENYFKTANAFRLTKVDKAVLDENIKTSQKSKDEQIEKMLSTSDKNERESLINQNLVAKDYALVDKLRQINQFHSLNNNDSETPQKKADILQRIGVTDAEKAKRFIEKDIFKDLKEAHEKEIESLQDDISGLHPITDKGQIAEIQQKIGVKNKEYKDQINSLKKEAIAAFTGSSVTSDQQSPPPHGPPPGDEPPEESNTQIHTPPIRPSGSSAGATYDFKEYDIPAYQRKAERTSSQEAAQVNPVRVTSTQSGGTTTYNGVSDQAQAQKLEEKRAERVEQALKEIPTPHATHAANEEETPGFLMDAVQKIHQRERLRNLREDGDSSNNP